MSDRVRHGIHPQLEALADGIIKDSLKGVTKHSDKSDLLTPWKLHDRKNREIYVPSGTPDAANRQGMFHRSHNAARPDLNSRDGLARARRGNPTTLHAFVEHHVAWDADDIMGEG